MEYHKTLSDLVERGGQSVNVYKKLQKELDYGLYVEAQIVRSVEELSLLVNNAIAAGENTLLFRYRGSAKTLENDLQKLYTLGLEQLKYSSSAFENTGDLKVNISWE